MRLDLYSIGVVIFEALTGACVCRRASAGGRKPACPRSHLLFARSIPPCRALARVVDRIEQGTNAPLPIGCRYEGRAGCFTSARSDCNPRRTIPSSQALARPDVRWAAFGRRHTYWAAFGRRHARRAARGRSHVQAAHGPALPPVRSLRSCVVGRG
jgi:hypothetical protein